jgi:hypothetical protein
MLLRTVNHLFLIFLWAIYTMANCECHNQRVKHLQDFSMGCWAGSPLDPLGRCLPGDLFRCGDLGWRQGPVETMGQPESIGHWWGNSKKWIDMGISWLYDSYSSYSWGHKLQFHHGLWCNELVFMFFLMQLLTGKAHIVGFDVISCDKSFQLVIIAIYCYFYSLMN